ncbi:MAG: prolyl-tRNA synthetase associated domain-containing protein [Alphaproteobacteria bacterium]
MADTTNHAPTAGPVAGAATPDDLFRVLHDLAITVHTVEHPAVFTVDQSQAVRRQVDEALGGGGDGGTAGHGKCLFLKDKKDRFVLVAALESTAVDLKALRRRLVAAGQPLQTLSFASAERLGQVMGVEPGTVTPFALLNPSARNVLVVLDPALFACRRVHFHPLRNTATTAIGPDDLVRFMESCGRAPLRLALGADKAAA